MLAALQRHRVPSDPKERRRIEKRFHKDVDAACAAYFMFNPKGRVTKRNFHSDMIERAVEFQFIHWPKKIFDDVHGKSVLDVGCGSGLKALGYLVVGVKSYAGMDPKMDLDSDRMKHPRTREWVPFGFSPRTLCKRCSRVELIPGAFESVAPDQRFDVAVMHNVTEHLMQIETVFADVSHHLHPGGALIFHHHNFYCWNGHHSPPKYIELVDQENDEQKKFVDWGHLSYQPQPDEYVATKLNRISLDDLRALTERHYEIEVWDEIPSDERRGGMRLTDEIRHRHPDRTDRDLLTQGVFCRAVRR